MNSYMHCQKSRYFQYRYPSEDLNNPKSIEHNKDRKRALTMGQTSMKITEFLIKLSKNGTKSVLLFFSTLDGSYNGCKTCTWNSKCKTS